MYRPNAHFRSPVQTPLLKIEAVISSFGQHKQSAKFSKGCFPSLQVVHYPPASTSTPSRKYVRNRRQRLSALIALLRGHPLFTTRKLPGAN